MDNLIDAVMQPPAIRPHFVAAHRSYRFTWNKPNVDAEGVVRGYLASECGPRIRRISGFSKRLGWYWIRDHTIRIGKIEKYVDETAYYRVLFHELAHSTMKGCVARPWRLHDAREEALAEVTSLVLLDRVGLLTDSSLERSRRYRLLEFPNVDLRDVLPQVNANIVKLTGKQ